MKVLKKDTIAWGATSLNKCFQKEDMLKNSRFLQILALAPMKTLLRKFEILS